MVREIGDDEVPPIGATGLRHNDTEASLSKNTEIFKWSSLPVDAPTVHGFDDELKSLERLLLEGKSNDGFKAIGIVGMAGVGKTTLAHLLFNKEQVKSYFLPRIWICMSNHPIEKEEAKIKMVENMLMCLGLEEETIEAVYMKHGLTGLLFALHLELKGKRYLIVLDDARNTKGWCENLGSKLIQQEEKWEEQIAYGLPKGHGGTVIITTRSKEVAKEMVGEKNIYSLQPRSGPESCWSIFKEIVEKEGKSFDPPNAESIKEEISNKCAGLPLAAKMMGQIMYDQLEKQEEAKVVPNEIGLK